MQDWKMEDQIWGYTVENGGPENAGPTTCAENAAIMSVISKRNVGLLINMTADGVMRHRSHSHYRAKLRVARYCHGKLSVCPSVRPSVCDVEV